MIGKNELRAALSAAFPLKGASREHRQLLEQADRVKRAANRIRTVREDVINATDRAGDFG